MTKADLIIRDPNVAVEFSGQIFSPEVQQSMVGWPDFEVFWEGVHGVVKGLYTTYEIDIHLRATRREVEQKDEHIWNLEARTEKAERELRIVNTIDMLSAGQSNPIVEERVTQWLINHAIADRQMTSMFAIEAAKTRAYEQGFYDSQKIGIEKTKEKLADEVCRYENRGFKHGWIKALQAAEALCIAGVDSVSPLYQGHNFPFSAFEMEKSDDEGGSE